MIEAVAIYVAFLAAGSGGFVWWRGRVLEELREGAAIEWDLLARTEPQLVAHLTPATFALIYRRALYPRAPGYVLATLAAVAASTVPAMVVMAGLYALFTAGGLNDPGPWVRGFYFFFGLVAFWVAVTWFFARAYHRRAPGELREEILRART